MSSGIFLKLRRGKTRIFHEFRRFPAVIIVIVGLVIISPLAFINFSLNSHSVVLNDALPALKTKDGSVFSGLKSLINAAKPVFELSPVLEPPHIETDGESREVVCPVTLSNPRKPDYHLTNLTLTLTDLRSDGDSGVWDDVLEQRYKKKLQDSNTTHNATTVEEPLLVYIVPFSHADPGWLMTVEEYFSTSTKLALDNMLLHLLEWPDMTFIWAETSYFKMWWETLSDQNKTDVKSLVKSGRLELVNGGYVMPDEANCHYYAILHQYIYGHQWLYDNVGTVPEHGFSIDPFGHSSSMPYILKNLDFKTIFIQRIHYNIRNFLAHQEATEFMWDQPWDHDDSASVFTHLAPHHLYTIKNICSLSPATCYFFDFKEVMFKMDHALLGQQAKVLLEQVRKTASIYPHNVVLYILGDDFRWSDKLEWFNQYTNYNKLMQEINKDPANNAIIKFGTLKDYYNAVFTRTGSTDLSPTNLPHIQGDFFPYADKYEDYWTGYFTSRPFYKQMSRELERDLRTAEMLYIMARSEKPEPADHYAEDLIGLQRAAISLGLFQHHDAITGTSKKVVALDYGDKLQNGLLMAHAVILKNIHRIAQISSAVFPATSNIILDTYRASPITLPVKSTLRFSESDTERRVFIFNPLARSREAVIHLLVETPNLVILDSDSRKIPYQISSVLMDLEADGTFTENLRASLFIHLDPLALKAVTVKSLGPRSKKVKIQQRHSVTIHSSADEVLPGFRVEKLDTSQDINITNPHFTAVFSSETGDFVEIVTKNLRHLVRLDLKRYETQASGAYLFRPNGIGDVNPYPRTIRVIRGHLFSELHVISARSYVHVTRVYHTRSDLGRAMELDLISDLRESPNTERVLKLVSDIRSNKTFYTDSNGFQIIRRHVSHSLPWAANYYPATTLGFIQDNTTRISLHLTQAHGVGSLKSGELEVMLDRNLMQDDGRGVGEALQDQRPVRTLLSLQIETEGFCTNCPYSNPSDIASRLNMDLNYPPYVTFEQSASNVTAFDFRPMEKPLPCDVHLVMMKPVTYRKDDDRVGFLFHRTGMECSTNRTDSEICDKRNELVFLSDVLKSGKFKSYNETGFNFVNARKRFSGTTAVKVGPMMLTAVTALLPSETVTFHKIEKFY